MPIPFSALCFVLVIDCLYWAVLNTSKALFAMVHKMGCSVYVNINVVYRAYFFTDTATCTSIGNIKVFIQIRYYECEPHMLKLP